MSVVDIIRVIPEQQGLRCEYKIWEHKQHDDSETGDAIHIQTKISDYDEQRRYNADEGNNQVDLIDENELLLPLRNDLRIAVVRRLFQTIWTHYFNISFVNSPLSSCSDR